MTTETPQNSEACSIPTETPQNSEACSIPTETPQNSEACSIPTSKKLQVSFPGPQGERLQRIAKLHGTPVSTFVALICHQWLFDNYKDHIQRSFLD